MSDEDLALWTGGKTSDVSQNSGAETGKGTGTIASVEEPVEETVSYWWYVMMGLLVVALAESLMSSRYLGTRQEAA
jgi:hypothetical protein